MYDGAPSSGRLLPEDWAFAGLSQGEFLCFSFSLHFFVAAFPVLLLFL